MKSSVIFLILSSVVYAEIKVLHIDLYTDGCSDSDGVDMYGLDGEEKWYADFNKQKGVEPLPPFADPLTYPGGYEQAVANQQICKQNLATSIKANKNPEEKIVPPHSSIYPRDDVVLGVKNTLICHVSGFHPAPVRVRWTRNNQIVTEGVRMSTPYPNQDFSHNQFSSLTFTPEEGDIYSCTVEHQGLSEPLTRIWEPEVTQPSVGPAVFCGVGLTLGLLGVATGTFFLIKGNECN
ncbi:H-2 class II histocompatibility antigen, A-U alpha chain-like precursor [Esox lucius]|uniref:H-2 class II histocompatibility antigen, A-B alpha chain n=1 Tax=Esox lucius TaxID=8010 RepID=C1BZV0_ESOLU|nr:H-2 class II histocompatibility antigen, A-U alpha chain-like precursor [Esox lucius]ACO14553.1 H-2 class II histocompatibility antigen, A-B alpha chain precursor [Esox lucius]